MLDSVILFTRPHHHYLVAPSCTLISACSLIALRNLVVLGRVSSGRLFLSAVTHFVSAEVCRLAVVTFFVLTCT